jgi:hypothetical protein
MAESEPFSPSHLVMIISRPSTKTNCLEEVLHQLRIGHQYSKLYTEEPTGLDFLWDIYELNPDLIVIIDESFPGGFITSSMRTIKEAKFQGPTIIVTSKDLPAPDGYTVVPLDGYATKNLEKIIKAKLSLA